MNRSSAVIAVMAQGLTSVESTRHVELTNPFRFDERARSYVLELNTTAWREDSRLREFARPLGREDRNLDLEMDRIR